MPYAEQRGNQLILKVRVSPNSKRSGIEGIWNGTHLKIALSAPPVDGKANEALIDFLSVFFKIRKSAITITAGHTSRQKQILISCPDNKVAAQFLSQVLTH